MNIKSDEAADRDIMASQVALMLGSKLVIFKDDVSMSLDSEVCTLKIK